MKREQNDFFVVMTDTFGGEANFSWVHHFKVRASSFRGAIGKVTRETGYRARKTADYGDMARYNVPGCAICYFVEWFDDAYHGQQSFKTL